MTISQSRVCTEEMIAPELHIYGISRIEDGNPSAKTIVIMPHKSKDRSQAIKSTSREVIEDQYQNLFGASFGANSLKAVFPLSVLTESNEVHIVFDRKLTSGSSAAKCCCKDCKVRFKLKKIK